MLKPRSTGRPPNTGLITVQDNTMLKLRAYSAGT